MNIVLEGKGIPITGLEAHRDVDARVHIFTATALGRGRVASSMFGHFYPWGKPQYSFYRRPSGPQDQSGHKGVKKNLHPSDTQDRPWGCWLFSGSVYVGKITYESGYQCGNCFGEGEENFKQAHTHWCVPVLQRIQGMHVKTISPSN